MNVNFRLSCFGILCSLCIFSEPEAAIKPPPSTQALLSELEDISSKLSAHETELSLLTERLDEYDTKIQQCAVKCADLSKKIEQLANKQKALETAINTFTTTVQKKSEELQLNHKQLSQDLRLLRRSIHALIEESSLEHTPDFSDHIPSHLHIVTSGDTLSKIAAKYNISLTELKKLNKLHSDTIYAGQKLRIRPE